MPEYSKVTDTNQFGSLFAKISTVNDLNLFFVELTELKNSLYKVQSGNWDEILNSKVRADMGAEIKTLVDQGMDKEKLIGELQDQIDALNRVEGGVE